MLDTGWICFPAVKTHLHHINLIPLVQDQLKVFIYLTIIPLLFKLCC